MLRMASRILATTLFERIRANPATPAIIEPIYSVRRLFPPRKNINKFLVGGAVEEVICDLIRSCGYACDNVSSTEAVIDIIVRDGAHSFPFSLKSIQRLGSAIIIENYRGKKHDIKDLVPTIVVVIGEKNLTLAYLDNPLLLESGATVEEVYKHADSNLSMRGGFVKSMITKTLPADLVINVAVPDLPDVAEMDVSALVVAQARAAVAAARRV